MPHGESAKGLRLVGHSDLGGHGDCMQMERRGEYLYVAHMGPSRAGTSILEVSDARRPKLVNQLPAPEGTHCHKVQLADGLMLVNFEQWGGGTPPRVGFGVFDLSKPTEPGEIGFFDCGGRGVHRMWYTGGPYAYVSGAAQGFRDRMLMIVSMERPERPEPVGRWWVEGTREGGGETPHRPEGRRYNLHHTVVQGDRAYAGLWDAGAVILDVSDPSQPGEVGRVSWPESEGGHTHTALPLASKGLMATTDEAMGRDCVDRRKRARLLDISDETRPRVVSLLPEPEGDFCERGLRFGPHNYHENRPGSWQSEDELFLTYFNAGVRIYGVADASNPVEVAHYLPASPPGQEAIQINDIYVDETGFIYISDRDKGGVYILERT